MKNMSVRLLGAVVFAVSAAHVCRDSLLSWALFILGGCALVLVLYEGKNSAATPVEIRARPLELQVRVLGADAKPLSPIKSTTSTPPPAPPIPVPAETEDVAEDVEEAEDGQPARTQAETNELAELIISALTNLKVPKDKARIITIRVLTEQPSNRDLPELVTSAIRTLRSPGK